MNDDENQLRNLAIGHYVVAAIEGLGGCLPILHLGVGLYLLFAPAQANPVEGVANRVFGGLFAGIALMAMLSIWTCAVCTAVAGRYLERRGGYRFCQVVAIVNCLFMPMGTILGVLTLIVLLRPSVRALFEGPPPIAAELAGASPTGNPNSGP